MSCVGDGNIVLAADARGAPGDRAGDAVARPELDRGIEPPASASERRNGLAGL
jgi:hypothetical protein